MLAKTLRSLESDGLVSRSVFATKPPSVEYDLTALGKTLLPHLIALAMWAIDNREKTEEARAQYEVEYP